MASAAGVGAACAPKIEVNSPGTHWRIWSSENEASNCLIVVGTFGFLLGRNSLGGFLIALFATAVSVWLGGIAGSFTGPPGTTMDVGVWVTAL